MTVRESRSETRIVCKQGIKEDLLNVNILVLFSWHSDPTENKMISCHVIHHDKILATHSKGEQQNGQ